MYNVRNVYEGNFEVTFYSTCELLQLRHLADNYPITTFSENKRFSIFFCKQTSEIQGSSMQLLKTLKPFEPTRPLRKQSSDS